MPSYKLFYFNVRGRAEISRWVFAQAEQEYEDVRLAGEEWGKKKPTTPFGQLPLLEVTDDAGNTTVIAQSHAIDRYLASEFGLTGKDNKERARGDMIGQHLTDLMQALPWTEKDPEIKKQKMKEAMEGPIAQGLKQLEPYVGASGYFVGCDVTLADLAFAVCMEMLKLNDAAVLDQTPKLKALDDKVRKLPKIAAWIAKRPVTTM